MAELTAPFVYKNDDKRIVYGPVLIPDEPDTDDDVVSADQIETVAHKFVEEYGNIDLMHSLNNVGKLVESYIVPVDMEINNETIVPKGSWIMGVRVTDDDTWEAVKENKLGGFSIMALQKTAMKSAEKDDSKRVTLADLGDDWIVNAVSLVDEPAVPKAKWIAIKSKDASENERNKTSKNTSEDNSDNVQKAIDGSLEHRRRLLDDSLNQMFKDYEGFPTVHSTMTDSVIFQVHYHDDATKTFQASYQLDENGNIDFTEEAREVQISENVVPVENMLPTFNAHTESEANKGQSEGFMSKFMKSIGLGSKNAEKAGRTISDGNYKKLQQAKEVIEELLAIGEKERSNKSEKGAGEMNKEEVQTLINETVEPLNSKMDDVLKSLKDEAKGEVSQEQDEKDKDDDQQEEKSGSDDSSKKSKDEQGSEENEENYKELYKQALKQLENKPFSRRLSGQDDDNSTKSKDEEKDTQTRNAFGFKK